MKRLLTKWYRQLIFPLVWKITLKSISEKGGMHAYPLLIQMEMIEKDKVRGYFIRNGTAKPVLMTIYDDFFSKLSRNLSRTLRKSSKRKKMRDAMTYEELEVYFNRIERWNKHLKYSALDKLVDDAPIQK